MDKLKNLAHHARSSLVIFDQALVSAANFLLSILIVRLVGLEFFGLFILAQLLVITCAALAQNFINAPLISIAPKLKDSRFGSVFSLGASLNFVVLGIFASMGVILADVYLHYFELSNRLPWLAPMISVFILLFGLNEYARRILFFQQRMIAVLTLDILRFSLIFAGIFIIASGFTDVIKSVENILYFVMLFFLGGISASLILAIIYLCPLFEFKNVQKNDLKRIIGSGRWLGMGALMQLLSEQYFMILVSVLLGPSQAGLLRLLQNLVGVLNPILHAIENIVPRKATLNLINSGAQTLNSYLIRYFMKLLVPLICVGLILVLPANFWLNWLFNVQYDQATMVLVLLMAVYLLSFMRLLCGAWFRAFEQVHYVFYAQCWGAFSALLIGTTLIWKYDILGAALGILISQSLIVAMMLVWIKKYQLHFVAKLEVD